MKEHEINDQTLGAYVDGLLDAEGCETVLQAMENDTEIRDAVYRIRRAKDLMKLGFDGVKPPFAGQQKTKPVLQIQRPLFAVASVAAFAAFFGVGLLSHHYYDDYRESQSGLAKASTARQQADRVLLHISESDPIQFAELLEYAERFVQEHKADGSQIEVVANATGIDMLREDFSPYNREIIALMEKYENVKFIACAHRLKVLRAEGAEPVIIEGVTTDVSFMDLVIDHMESGWKYIKVEELAEI